MKVLINLIVLSFFMTALSTTIYAQRCTATASQIYFVEDGKSVLDVHPGDRGYQLNILGTNADKFELIKDPCMTAISVIPNYTAFAAAKWQVNFAPDMERVLCSVSMKNKCTGQITTYSLTSGVRLFNR